MLNSTVRAAFAASICISAAVAPLSATAASESLLSEDYLIDRTKMIEAIVTEVRLTQEWIGKSAIDPRVLSVMAQIPRHEFVPPKLSGLAYLNRPLPVGHGQTVSQPYMVALMTDLAGVKKGDDVLLLGIGGGYHAAVIADLAGAVHIVDMQPSVAAEAMNTLFRLGYRKVALRNEDPYFGWTGTDRKFDAIIVRQATDYIPDALVSQLKSGGKIVVPVGASPDQQDLIVGTKTGEGRLLERSVLPVRFTRLPGGPRI